MEEKMIIQSKRSYIKALKMIICILLIIEIIGLLLVFVISPLMYNDEHEFYVNHQKKYITYLGDYQYVHDDYTYLDSNYEEEWSRKWNMAYHTQLAGYIVCGIGGLSLFFLLFLWAIAKMEINVTDKRVYGKARFGKRVDLPLDSISAVATGILKGISVASSSGKIHFTGISNNKEIHEAISNLLIERQGKEKPVATTTIKQEIPQSKADELKKFKELLDSGVITQEEFDAKKKQLLGL